MALFLLAVIGTVWTTVFAALEYHAERLEEFTAIARTIVLGEAYYQYLRPTLCRKIKTWSLDFREQASDSDNISNIRTIFIGMQRSLMLQADEYLTYVTLCQDAAHSRRLWLSKSHMHTVIEDICCDYMYHPTFTSELWEYLTTVHNK